MVGCGGGPGEVSLGKLTGAGESDAARFGEEAPLVVDEPEADRRRLREASPFVSWVIWAI